MQKIILEKCDYLKCSIQWALAETEDALLLRLEIARRSRPLRRSALASLAPPLHPTTSGDAQPRGRLLHSTLAAWCELELFDGVGNVGLLTAQPDRCGDLNEHLAGWANKWLSAALLHAAGLFADDHQISVEGVIDAL